MPTYPYVCTQCEDKFEVVKSLARIEDNEICEKCGGLGSRYICAVNFTNAGDWKPSFNPAFGCVVRSKTHQREILAKFKGEGREFQEVGNEPVENIHKYYDNQRETKQKERWSESPDQVLSEGLR